MPFQSHIARSGQCDNPTITPGMPNYQPRTVAWVNEWTRLNPAGFKNRKVGVPAAPPRVPYHITADTIACSVERAQSCSRIVPAAFLASGASLNTQAGGPNLPQNTPLPSMPTNHVAHIMHRHDFPPRPESRSARVPEYSHSAVVGYDDDSLDEDDRDSRRTPPPSNRNTRQHQYTNSPQYDRDRRANTSPPRQERSHSIARTVYRRPKSVEHAVRVEHDNELQDELEDEVVAEVSTTLTALPVVAAVQMPIPPSHSSPFSVPHLMWNCAVDDFSASSSPCRPVHALLDHGSPVILIREELVMSLNLRCRRLYEPFIMDTATPSASSSSRLTEWVKFQLHDPYNRWTSSSVRAIIAPSLCADIILGLPFLSHNQIVVDAASRSVVHKPSGFDLLSPLAPVLPTPPPRLTLKESLLATKNNISKLCTELKSVCASRRVNVDLSCEPVRSVDIIAAVRTRIENLAVQEELEKLGTDIKELYKDVFSPLPHVDEMPDKITYNIQLVDATKTIASRSYNCPCKFRQAWQTLIQQHLDAGRIRPSSSPYASPAFLIPKPESTVLPRWVNDYRQLNANIVTDRYPLHRIDDILADAGSGKIWSKLDMTDSFFHTKMHPDSIPLTAVNTPFGLYEWTVMPQGMKNSPSVHQRRVNEALRQYIGVFCHIYLDDIIIWSQSLEEHQEHVRLIMNALRTERLYCNS